MSSKIIIFIILLSATFMAISTLSQAMDADAAVGMYIGGSDYVLLDTGNYKNKCNDWDCGWDEVKAVIPYYDTYKDTVRSQLQSMRDSGQDRIVLLMWYNHLVPGEHWWSRTTPAYTYESGDFFMNAVASNGGKVSPRIESNIRGLIADIKSLGFKELIFRFGPTYMGIGTISNDPHDWETWNETLYDEDESIVLNVHAIVSDAWCGNANGCGGNGLMFDLAGEAGGRGFPIGSGRDGQLGMFQQRLWSKYTSLFGSSDTVGFSYIGDPSYVGNLVNDSIDYLYTSVRPPVFGFDIYDKAYDAVIAADKALSSRGLSTPIIILETYYNDQFTSSEFQRAQTVINRPILELFQWPVIRNSFCAHFSVDYPKDYYNYRTGTIASNSTHLDLLPNTAGVVTINWNTTIYSTSQVWVSVNGQGEVLFAQGKSGYSNAPWIVCPNTYTFNLYAETSHSTKLDSVAITSSCITSSTTTSSTTTSQTISTTTTSTTTTAKPPTSTTTTSTITSTTSSTASSTTTTVPECKCSWFVCNQNCGSKSGNYCLLDSNCLETTTSTTPISTTTTTVSSSSTTTTSSSSTTTTTATTPPAQPCGTYDIPCWIGYFFLRIFGLAK
jgi:hypothetical protein